jgi:hypothetical protein
MIVPQSFARLLYEDSVFKKVLADEPGLLKLRELKTLEAMADNGARFVVGLAGQRGNLWGRDDKTA